MRLKSDFALLDVTAGRKALSKHFAAARSGALCPPDRKIPVTITGFIVGQWGSDDGVSTEFEVEVTDLKVPSP